MLNPINPQTWGPGGHSRIQPRKSCVCKRHPFTPQPGNVEGYTGHRICKDDSYALSFILFPIKRVIKMLKRQTLETVKPLSQDYLGAERQTKGYVEQAISADGRGRVRYQATYWFGICDDGRSLPKGTEVTVIGRQGNTLIVAPLVTP